MNEETQNSNNQNNNNLKPYMLWLLILTFVAPIGAAYWLYNIGGTEQTVNRGEFVKSGVQLMDLNLVTMDGKAATEKDVYGHWHMMTFIGSECVGECEEIVYTMRQIRTTFHKESPRITNVLIHFEEGVQGQFKEKIKTHYAHFERYKAKREDFNRALDYKGSELTDKNIIFIVDPIGNVILKYTKDKTAKDIMRDLKRLLKASQIG